MDLTATIGGAKVVSAMLRDAGVEVVYLGRFQTPESIVSAAVQEDVDAIGLSCLNGEHLSFTPMIVSLLKQKQAQDIQLVVGCVIPGQDIPQLKDMGVAEIFTGGTTSDQIVEYLQKTVGRRRIHQTEIK